MPVTTRSRSTPATEGAVDTAQPTTRAVKPEEAGRHGNGWAVSCTSLSGQLLQHPSGGALAEGGRHGHR